jgi:hypothetical protein
MENTALRTTTRILFRVLCKYIAVTESSSVTGKCLAFSLLKIFMNKASVSFDNAYF